MKYAHTTCQHAYTIYQHAICSVTCHYAGTICMGEVHAHYSHLTQPKDQSSCMMSPQGISLGVWRSENLVWWWMITLMVVFGGCFLINISYALLSGFVECLLIGLDKSPGIRPISIARSSAKRLHLPSGMTFKMQLDLSKYVLDVWLAVELQFLLCTKFWCLRHKHHPSTRCIQRIQLFECFRVFTNFVILSQKSTPIEKLSNSS